MGAASLNRVYRRGLNVRVPETSEVATWSKKFLFIIQGGGGNNVTGEECSDYIYFHWSITSRGLGATLLGNHQLSLFMMCQEKSPFGTVLRGS